MTLAIIAGFVSDKMAQLVRPINRLRAGAERNLELRNSGTQELSHGVSMRRASRKTDSRCSPAVTFAVREVIGFRLRGSYFNKVKG